MFARNKQDPEWYPDIEKLAEKAWMAKKTLPFVGVYVSPYGEHQVIPIRYEDIDEAIQALQELKERDKCL